MKSFYRLMLITQKKNIPIQHYLDFIKKCADGGISALQLREKSLSFTELVDFGYALLEILQPYQIPLIINDFPLLAQELKTPYLHLGQNDSSINHALSLVPSAKIGVSIETDQNIYEANLIPNLAYVTASAIFDSTNKNNIKTIWGLEGLQKLSSLSKHPLTAIGGITLQNTAEIIQHGAKGIALIGAIHNTEDPYQTTKEFRRILDSCLGEDND